MWYSELGHRITLLGEREGERERETERERTQNAFITKLTVSTALSFKEINRMHAFHSSCVHGAECFVYILYKIFIKFMDSLFHKREGHRHLSAHFSWGGGGGGGEEGGGGILWSCRLKLLMN